MNQSNSLEKMEAEDPHSNTVIGGASEGEHNHHGEKKSVLKKVKDKAKKIKDTIRKHGGHTHDHDQISKGEDDEDEETVNAPEFHVYESGFISCTHLPKQTGLDVERPTRGPPEDPDEVYLNVGGGRGVTTTTNLLGCGETSEDYYGDGRGVTKMPGVWDEMYNSDTRNEVFPDGRVTDCQDEQCNTNRRDEVYPHVGIGEEVTRTSGPGKLEESSPVEPQLGDNRQDAMDLKEASMAEPMVKIGPLVELVEDPHSPGDIPLSNYQTKVVDPTSEGGREVEVAPLVRRLDNLHVGDEHESEQRSCTGSHDQFAPQSTPTNLQFNPESDPVAASRIPESPKTFDPERPESMPRDTIAGKISSATSVIADKAVSAKNVVALKMGYGGQLQDGQDSSKTAALEPGTEYGSKVAQKLTPVNEKVAGAGGAVMSRVERGGDTAAKDTDKGVSVKEYLAEKLSPGEEDKALCEAITDAIHNKREGGMIWRTGEEHSRGQGNKSGKESEGEGLGAGTGVVDRVKGWLGMSSGTQAAQHSDHGDGVM